jgi:hypothetical protein
VGDPRVAQRRRWRVLWVHHEAEELRVHYRETIPEMTARHVIVDLLASGQVAADESGTVGHPPGFATDAAALLGNRVSGGRGGLSGSLPQ